MSLTVPTPTNGYPDETVRVSLDGRSYSIRWLWNGREGVWSFSIADADGTDLQCGVRVVLGANLLEWTSDPRAPGGAIMVVDATGGTTEPDLDTLGQRVQVIYLTADEIAA